jgi:CheY-like chemotaxis protein
MTNQLNHIFYIDDDLDILAVVKFALTKIGKFTVSTRSDSKLALLELANITPDLIMVDVMMPDMDGPTVINRIRTMPHLQQTPIVLTTAAVQNTDIENYKSLNVAGVLQKPFHSLDLVETIRGFWLEYQKSHPTLSPEIPSDLQADYLKTLNLYHKQLHTFLQQYQQATENRTDIENVAILAHKLIGSGATYGYPNISDSAQKLKNAINDNNDRLRLQSATFDFLHCLEEAISA